MAIFTRWAIFTTFRPPRQNPPYHHQVTRGGKGRRRRERKGPLAVKFALS